MDGAAEPSMPRLPSVINTMKDAPGGRKSVITAGYMTDPGKRKTSIFDEEREFAAITEGRRMTFSSGGGDAEDEDTELAMRTMFGKMTLSAKQKADIAEAFNAFDVLGTGFMSTTDLRVALKALGFEARTEHVLKILETWDIANSGKLCYSDFMNIIEQKLGEHETKDDLIKTFKLFDKGKVGHITFENLRAVADELEEVVNDEEISEMITEADLDDNGVIDEDEFLKILKKSTLY